MSPTIRIDDAVYAALQELATPFVDTPNTVVRRLLGLGPIEQPVPDATRGEEENSVQAAKLNQPAHPRRSKARLSREKKSRWRRAPTGTLLPEGEYVLPLLEALIERGGAAPANDVIEAVGEKLGPRLTELDRSTVRSGGVRWRGRLQFVRLRLLEQGLLKRGSPRGTWEISQEGESYLAGMAHT